MKKLSNSGYAKLVGLVCVLCVGVTLWDYYLGCALLVVLGVPMALWYNHRLKRERKQMDSAGISGVIHCECFEGGSFWGKGDRALVCVYPDRLGFRTGSGEERGCILRQDLTAAGVLTLDQVRSGDEGLALGKLRETVLETDRIARKKPRRGGEAKYLILNLEGQVLSFFITAADQRENRLCSDTDEQTLIREFLSGKE